MERAARLTLVQRGLALALLAPVLAAAWLEGRSPVSAAIRRREPWACWLALKPESSAQPQLFLALYRPRAPALELIHVPDSTPLEGKKTLAKAAALARKDGAAPADSDAGLVLADEATKLLLTEGPEELRAALQPGFFHYEETASWTDEAPVEAHRLARRLWRRETGPGALEWFERLRLRLELLKLSDDDIHAGYLPESKEERTAYFKQLIGVASPARDHEAPTVEVLNATPQKGVASRATKILRSRGADVMSTGNAPARSRTLVLDRTGRPEVAAQVRRMLGCRSAEQVTQIDVKRLVDVSVVVADDCLEPE